MTKCSNCEGDGVHLHHIVPKSRGGSDNPSNLVLLCLDCHSKAHNVSFKSDGGIIKDAVKRTKDGWKVAGEWFRDNSDDIFSFLDFLYDYDETLHNFFLSGMTLGYIRNDDVWKIFTGQSTRSALCLNKTHQKDLNMLWSEFSEIRGCKNE